MCGLSNFSLSRRIRSRPPERSAMAVKPSNRSKSSMNTSSRCGTRSAQSAREVLPSDRKSVVEGKSVSVRVDLGGRRNIKQKKIKNHRTNQSQKKQPDINNKI